jgi:hypothetical protein
MSVKLFLFALSLVVRWRWQLQNIKKRNLLEILFLYPVVGNRFGLDDARIQWDINDVTQSTKKPSLSIQPHQQQYRWMVKNKNVI